MPHNNAAKYFHTNAVILLKEKQEKKKVFGLNKK